MEEVGGRARAVYEERHQRALLKLPLFGRETVRLLVVYGVVLLTPAPPPGVLVGVSRQGTSQADSAAAQGDPPGPPPHPFESGHRPPSGGNNEPRARTDNTCGVTQGNSPAAGAFKEQRFRRPRMRPFEAVIDVRFREASLLVSSSAALSLQQAHRTGVVGEKYRGKNKHRITEILQHDGI
ncbi:hypothetical protein AAFF_G00294120 [Aldrovandia affinis]|uniref:Uncharacterized protein n=1 Tax=Aldrovandia affinis TaxID=143900 RepID=A0AAD7W189_9TELE|nr:hypothetical protein AAFF_G00294120 [Aldrovandia affinis]